MFKEGKIDGVEIRLLKKYADKRGWLAELFREDQIDKKWLPVMSYASLTLPGVTRGPHEHVDQADFFCFIGPSSFKMTLWDNRPQSPTYRNRMEVVLGEESPGAVIVPEGVVHAYQNVGGRDGLVLNFPNRLYMGWGKKEKVDEIRHEDDPQSPFVIDLS